MEKQTNKLPLTKETVQHFYKNHTRPICLGIFGFVIAVLFLYTCFKVYGMSQRSDLDADYRWTLSFCYVLKFFLLAGMLGAIMACFFTKLALHRLYFFSALGLGILYMIIITPFSVPDESYHYYHSLKLSNMMTFNFQDTLRGNDLEMDNFTGHRNDPRAYQRLKDPLFAGQGEVFTYPKPYDTILHVSYPPQFLPQAVGLTIGRVLHLNFIWKFYLGRLCNLIFFALCVSLAIKRIPFAKQAVFLIGLLPMCMQQAASFSYDCFINGLAILLVASIVHSIYKEHPISLSEILWIVIVAALLSPANMAYFPLVFLCLLIPKKRFKNPKNCLAIKSAMIGTALFFMMLFTLSYALSVVADSTDKNWEGGINYTVSDLIENPKHTIKIFENTFRVCADLYIYTTLGQRLSGWTLEIPRWLFNTTIILLVLASQKQLEDRIAPTTRHRFFIAFLFCSTLLLVMSAMLLGWTSNTREVIEGVQGRYFVPLILPFCLILRNHILVLTKNITQYLFCVFFPVQCCILWKVIGITIAGWASFQK